MVCAVEPHPTRRLFLFVATCTSGSVLLFCGHIELYVWAGALFVWFLAISYERRIEGGFTAVLVLGILTVLLNFMLLPAASAVVALLRVNRSPGTAGVRKWLSPVRVIAAFAIGSLMLAFVLQWFSLSYGTVPLIPHTTNQYWFLSKDHVSDILNTLVFAAPLCVLILVKPGLVATFREYWILLMAAALPWLVSFWIDPDAGAVRDWDLLSIYGIPFTLLMALAIVKWGRDIDVPKLVLPVLCLSLFLLGPYLYERFDSNRLVSRVNAIIYDDPHYQTNYQNGLRCVSWGALLNNEAGRDDLAETYLRRRIEADTVSAVGYANMGQLFLTRRQFDSAEVYLRGALLRDTNSVVYAGLLSNALLFQSKWEELAPLLIATEHLDSARAEALQVCGRTLLAAKKPRAALQCFVRLDSYAPGNLYFKLAIAMSFAMLENKDSTMAYYRQAESLCPKNSLCQFYTASIGELADMGRLQVARELLPRYRSKCSDVDSAFVARISNSPIR
jgi:tetratricopeptide (TPR) repeat protein